jgi:hypothetical protein
MNYPSLRELRLVAVLSSIAVAVFATTAFAQDIVYPTDANVVNVKNPPYNAKGDGVTDDTAAIQQAITDHLGFQFSTRTLYFPNGTYLVSNTLGWASSNAARFFIMQGQSRTGTIIKLKNSAVGFNSTATPKALMDCQVGSTNNNVAFGCYVENLTFDTGTGNPGAMGIDYISSNFGAIRNVTVKGSGLYGLAFIKAWPGPFLVRNVRVEGFQHGIRVLQGQYGITFENIELSNQTVAGISVLQNMLAIRNLTTTAATAVPAILMESDRGSVTLLNATCSFTGSGTASGGAIRNANGGSLYVRGVSSSKYQYTVSSNSTEITANLTGTVSEFSSHDVRVLFGSAATSLQLPIQETPAYENNTFTDWAKVVQATNSTTGAQNAMNAGKPVVYFPANPTTNLNWYRFEDTITIPAGVRRIRGMGQPIRLGIGFNNTTKPIFRVSGTTANPLIIENFGQRSSDTGVNVAGVVFVEHASSRPLVLKSIPSCTYRSTASSGNLFLEDVAGAAAAPDGWSFRPGQNVWARQWNAEDLQNGAWPLIVNDGAKVWALSLKTEGAKTIAETKGGGSTEILGGFFYPVNSVPAALPLFINNESSFSAAGYLTQGNYDIQVSETRNGITQQILDSQMPVRAVNTVKVSLTAGIAPAQLGVWTNGDIGSVGVAGSASLSGGTFTVRGSGNDIWGTSDGFHFVRRQISGNMQMTARVVSIQNTNPSAKASVMIRESLAANSRHTSTVLTPSNGGSFERRASTGGTTTKTAVAGIAAPYWIRIERVGNVFTSYRSTNGTAWTLIGSQTITMGASVFVGMAVTSHANTVLCSAVFDNVSLVALP